jgi:hypothetical protein
MYKTKTIYPKYKNDKLSLLFIYLWVLKKNFIFSCNFSTNCSFNNLVFQPYEETRSTQDN